jgi:hypothetical protein
MICFSRSDWGEKEIVAMDQKRRRKAGTVIPCIVVKKKGGTLQVEPAWGWQPFGLMAPEGQENHLASLMAVNVEEATTRFFPMLAAHYVKAKADQDEFNRITDELKAQCEAVYEIELIGQFLLKDGVWTWKVKRTDNQPMNKEQDKLVLEYLGRKAGATDSEQECACFEEGSFASDMECTTGKLLEEGYRFVQFDRFVESA